MRADLHVHSLYSAPRHFRRVGLRDCYAAPEAIYHAAKRAGMDLVTITDRDTIEGCLRYLEKHPDASDFTIGEEVEAALPGLGLRVHLNMWGISEGQHAEISRLRGNLEDLAGYLRAERIALGFNHFVGKLPVDLPSASIYRKVLAMFDGLEVRNGSQGRQYNLLVSSLAVGEAARRSPVAFLGGSDAHTLRRIGTTWTEAAAASREEFLEAIRRGRTSAGGRVGSASDIVRDIGSLTISHYASLWSSLRSAGDGRAARSSLLKDLALGAAAFPIQAIGAPVVGAAIYFWRVRAQVRVLRREIAGMDLDEFRTKMSSFPRSAGDLPDGSPGSAGTI